MREREQGREREGGRGGKGRRGGREGEERGRGREGGGGSEGEERGRGGSKRTSYQYSWSPLLDKIDVFWTCTNCTYIINIVASLCQNQNLSRSIRLHYW